MTSKVGTSGLIFNEPLLWEIGSQGRMGFSMPVQDVPAADLDERLAGDRRASGTGAAPRR